MNDVISRVLELHSLKAAKLYPVQKGYRNRSYKVELENSNLINVLVYKTEDNLLKKVKAANTISNYLYLKNFPTRNTLDTNNQIVKLTYNQKNTYISLYNYLPGEPIMWEAWTRRHLKLLGWIMAEMHKELKLVTSNFNSLQFENVIDTVAQYLESMINYFNSREVENSINLKLKLQLNKSKLIEFQGLLLEFRNSSVINNSFLHMDLVRSNVLFDEAENIKYRFQIDNVAISGLIDFEKVAFGLPVFDIARTLAFLLVDCKYKSSEKIIKYFIKDGYLKRGSCPIVNLSFLPNLVLLFLTYDFYKFLKHNPYESLAANVHYNRTLQILLHNGLVKAI